MTSRSKNYIPATRRKLMRESRHTADGKRICKDCGVAKELDKFHIAYGAYLDRSYTCKECRKIYYKRWRDEEK